LVFHIEGGISAEGVSEQGLGRIFGLKEEQGSRRVKRLHNKEL
jgi:hypothetical protein